MIRHIVLLRLRTGGAVAELASVFAELAEVRDLVPGILDFAAGASLRLEGLEHGFLHGFVVDFADRAALDAHQAHPAHRRAGDRLVGLAEGGRDGLLVFDLPVAAAP